MKTRKTILVTILAITLILSSQLVKAQFPTDTTTGKVQYSGILELPGFSKEKIFDKAKYWIASTLKSSDNMTELDNEKHEKIIGTGNVIIDSLRLPYGGTYADNSIINFKFIILIKEGKVKYIVNNFILLYSYNRLHCELGTTETGLENIKTPQKGGWTKKMTAKFNGYVFEAVNPKISQIILDFSKSFNREENNNW